MNVLFFLPYPLNTVPGQRLKFEQYFDHFKKNGISIDVCTFITQDFYHILYRKGHYAKKCFYTLNRYFARLYHIIQTERFEVIYFFLWAVPFGPPVYEALLKKSGKPIIYDIDDLVFLPHSSNANRFINFLKGKNRIQYSMKMADHVIVCTEYLKRYALQFNKNVTNISSTIDTDKYFVKNSYSNKKRITIGWSGSHSTSPYLHLLDKVLKKIQDKYNTNIKVIGDRNFNIPDVSISAQDWKYDTEVHDLQHIDIGLYPLPEEEWVLGKSGLKALQYMGLGIPTVAQAIGANFDIIKDGHNGFLAGAEKDWYEKIAALVEDPYLRRKIGLNGRKTVEDRYSVRVNASVYLDILNKVYYEKSRQFLVGQGWS